MSLTINISTLDGNKIDFDNINPSWDVKEFKKYIYNNHPNINKIYPKELSNNFQIELIYKGSKLHDLTLLNELKIDDTFIFLIKSKHINIEKKKYKKTICDEYIVSPCSEKEIDVFEDTFEFDDKIQNDRDELLRSVNKKLEIIEKLFNQISTQLNTIN
jgi:hypothetical protein